MNIKHGGIITQTVKSGAMQINKCAVNSSAKQQAGAIYLAELENKLTFSMPSLAVRLSLSALQPLSRPPSCGTLLLSSTLSAA
ncbi:hypothetical protein B4900_16765 [Yersinia rohdei]|nr:hypothetical protein B4900_16765 [Yersinia rohdei]